MTGMTIRSRTQQTMVAPANKPVLSWVINPATGHPVMMWSLLPHSD